MVRSFPTDERFGLSSQLRRSGVGIASNIAEGYGRGSRADYVRFLKMAGGCTYEVDTQLLFALRLEYVTEGIYRPVKELLDEAERILAGLIQSLEKKK